MTVAGFHTWLRFMHKVPRFLLYWFAILAGLTGVVVGVISLFENWRKRSFDSDYALLSSSSDYFSSAVILLLSLILLILVHIGHVLVGGLHLTKRDKATVPPEAKTGSTPPTVSKKSNSPSPPDDPSTNEKLAHLLKPPAD